MGEARGKGKKNIYQKKGKNFLPLYFKNKKAMELIEFIRAACASKQVPKEYAEKIQKMFNITEQKGIDVAVDAFKENILPDILSNATAVEDARKKALEDYEKKHNLKDGKPIETPTTPTPPRPQSIEGLSPEFKALFDKQNDAISKLTDLVGGVVKTQANGEKLAEVKALLKGKVDDKHIDRIAGKINLDAEDLNAEIEAQVKDYAEMKKDFISTAVASGDYVPADGSVSEKEFEDYLERNKEKESDFEGVKI